MALRLSDAIFSNLKSTPVDKSTKLYRYAHMLVNCNFNNCQLFKNKYRKVRNFAPKNSQQTFFH